MWGAGLSFHRCHAELVVPVDPYLDHVFDGEEGSRGIRFFTHGYDVYTPDRVLVTHDYQTHQSNPVVHTWGRKNLAKDNPPLKPPSWKFMKDIENARSQFNVFGTERVNLLLGIGPRKGEVSDADAAKQRPEVDRIRKSRFGLGTKRTLDQAIEFTGLDLKHRKMRENKCGNLIWVPFEESEQYGVPDIMQRIPVNAAFTPAAKPKAAAAAVVDESQQQEQPPPQQLLRQTYAAPAQVIADHTNMIAYIEMAVCCLLLALVVSSRSGVFRRRKKARHTN